jgi:DNA polymerase III subunit alpha
MSSSFAHLHLHSQFSLLDGANRLDEVIQGAKDAGMAHLALTDHGNLFGAIDFYRKAKKAGVRPIIGIEAYMAQGSRTDREKKRPSNNHLVLLARNEAGYRNLVRLTSRSFLDGFYYKPRIDKELLRQHSEGLIGLSACLKGEINEQIMARREAEAEATAREYREILGEENFFLEIQDHGIEEQRAANEVLRRISKRTDIPLVASNDCHYLRKDDAHAHDVLLCIGTQRSLSDPDRLKYASDQFYLKGEAEMRALFPNDQRAIDNTVAIAERCNVDIRFDQFHLPDFPVPEGYTLDSYLAKVTGEGLEGRLEELRRRRAQVLENFPVDLYHERLKSELATITAMNFAGYFLIVWDFIRYARQRNIPVGPGRGSAAGSLVAYVLRITDIDPLQYDLLFERFLNPERVSLPDIDIDFCMRRRGEVIQYVSERYGRDHVAQIITFGTLAAKAVIRDVGRVMGVPYAKVDRIAKMIPDMTRSLSAAWREIPELKSEVERDPEVREIVQVGERLEGLTRHASLHAAGVVITPRPTEELVPLYKTSKDEIVTQWDKDVIEDLGLLKMDFLGLKTLTVIDDTLRLLALQGAELDLDNVPLDDPAVFELFSEGGTSGIFQFESGGMKDLLRRVRPSRFEDLVALNALYRPGALSSGMVDEYVLRKNGVKEVRYILPEVEPILAETYGVIAYQEQVMQIAGAVAGFSMREADLLRKAMGKKKVEVMAQQKQKFVDGADARGVPKKKAQELWEHIEPFAGYGFNKSHSVAYAMLAYKTAYLKAHHPVAFMAAMLTCEMSTKDNVAKYVRECRQMEMPVLPPDINESNWAFTVVGGTIRFGLGAVKGLGSSAVEAILEARQRVGRFPTFTRFAREVDQKALNSKVFECLIKAGCFDSLDYERSGLMASLERILDYAQTRQREAELGQSALFGGDELPDPDVDREVPPWPERERLSAEKEVLGLYVTGNPLSQHRERLEALVTHSTAALREERPEGRVTLGGVVTRLRRTKIKSGRNAGKMMARFVLEDLEGTVRAAVFSEQLLRVGHLLDEEATVLATGLLREAGAQMELTVEEVVSLESASEGLISHIEMTLAGNFSTAHMLRLRNCLIEHHGEVPVRLSLTVGSCTVSILPEERFRVAPGTELIESVELIVGRGNVHAHYAIELGAESGAATPA